MLDKELIVNVIRSYKSLTKEGLKSQKGSFGNIYLRLQMAANTVTPGYKRLLSRKSSLRYSPKTMVT